MVYLQTASDICQWLDNEAEGLSTPIATDTNNTATTSGGSTVVTTSNATFGTDSGALIPKDNRSGSEQSGTSESSSEHSD